MAWFGPKGVATMTFALLVLAEGVPDGERIFNLAALCVFASILAHGLTDTPGPSGSLGVKSGLLLGVRERPRRLPPALLPEHEAHLLRRAQALRVVGRNVGQGSSSSSAQRRFLRKKQSSQLTFLTFLTATTPSPLVHHPSQAGR